MMLIYDQTLFWCFPSPLFIFKSMHYCLLFWSYTQKNIYIEEYEHSEISPQQLSLQSQL